LSKIKAVLLDFDGVLSSLIARIGWPFYHALRRVRPTIKKEEILIVLEKIIQFYLHSETKSLFYVPKIILKIARILRLQIYQIPIFIMSFLILFRKNLTYIFPEKNADKVLHFVTSNYLTALITHAEPRVIEQAYQKFRFLKNIDLIISRKELKYTKPNPYGIRLALKSLKLHPEEALYVGDLPHDIEAGRRAGTLTCGVVNFAAAEKEKRKLLEQFKPDFLITHISELPQLLQSLQK